MKKILLTAICSVWGVLAVSAQSSMTADELRFRNGIEQFLKEQGYVPTIDTEDNSLNFKIEGKRFWLTVKGSSPTYIEIHKAGFSLDGVNRAYLIEACNKANYETRCAKAYVMKSSVSFTVEVFCNSVNEFRQIFYRSLDTLDGVRERTKKYYNELDQ